MSRAKTAIVVGAGIAGSTTALALLRQGLEVTLIDAAEPGHAAAASGGESRIIRSSHGTDEFYAQMSREARFEWIELGQKTGRELFVQTGCVMLASQGNTAWEDASRETLSSFGIPHFIVPASELPARLPTMNSEGFEYGLWEPEAGFIFAGQATIAVVGQFVAEGGELARGLVTTSESEKPLLNGTALKADVIVMACGAWMSSIFPRTLRRKLEVSRQNVIMVSTPLGDNRFDSTHFPCWIDHGNGAYGIPAAGGYGFKPVIIWRQLSIDLDTEDRIVDQTSIARMRRYLANRFPELQHQPISNTAVCQIANTADTHWIVDQHPEDPSMLLIAGDSGHLFKHGLAFGRYAAEVALHQREANHRFRLQDRTATGVESRPQ